MDISFRRPLFSLLIAAIALSALWLMAKVVENHTATPNPFAGKTLYPIEVQACYAGERSTPQQQAAAEFVCAQPAAKWLIGTTDPNEVPLPTLLQDAQAQGKYPVLVLYNIPNRDCGLYAAQDTPVSSEEYLRWVEDLATHLGSHDVAVLLEPDALPQVATEAHCFADSGPLSSDERVRLIRQAISILKKNPNTAVYLDAGNALWAPAPVMASILKKAGIANADGFSLNISSRSSTEDSIAYGKEISRRVGGKGFVIDTSRNGNINPSNPMEWCNPEDEALGDIPTTTTPDPAVHALLWVKGPGESDGECAKGHPPAGEFWIEKLESLYQNSKHAQ